VCRQCGWLRWNRGLTPKLSSNKGNEKSEVLNPLWTIGGLSDTCLWVALTFTLAFVPHGVPGKEQVTFGKFTISLPDIFSLYTYMTVGGGNWLYTGPKWQGCDPCFVCNNVSFFLSIGSDYPVSVSLGSFSEHGNEPSSSRRDGDILPSWLPQCLDSTKSWSGCGQTEISWH
jgi:hypothetical protein